MKKMRWSRGTRSMACSKMTDAKRRRRGSLISRTISANCQTVLILHSRMTRRVAGSWSRSRRWVAVEVEATGRGVAADDPRVFTESFPKVLTMQTDRGANVVAAFKNVAATNCVAHKIHRSVQKTLTKKKGSYFEKPFARIRKLCTLVRRAPQCGRIFRKLQKLHNIGRVTKPPQYIETRWTVAFDLMDWCSKNRLPVQSFASQPIPGKRTTAEEEALRGAIDLTRDDWDALLVLKKVLEPIALFTRSIQVMRSKVFNISSSQTINYIIRRQQSRPDTL
eukprot:GHVU01192727.1.p1 GENE.GHVU01192727.1~~GHVU01192727.1.p1  ORF type:complete len:279 (-),score=22.54 GHVU01192727.1:1420-2256(-)